MKANSGIWITGLILLTSVFLLGGAIHFLPVSQITSATIQSPLEQNSASPRVSTISTPTLVVTDASTVSDICYGKDDNVLSLAFDHNGYLWSNANDKIFRWDLQTKTYANHSPSNAIWPPASVQNLIVDQQNDNVWVSTKNGLWQLLQVSSEWIEHLPSFRGYVADPLAISPNGKLWASIGVYSDNKKYDVMHQLFRFDGRAWVNYDYGVTSEDRRILSMVTSADEGVWVSLIRIAEGGTYSKGVWYFDSNTWNSVPEVTDYNLIYKITKSPAGSLWFVAGNSSRNTYTGNIKKFDGKKWETYNVEVPATPDALTASQNMLWMIIYKELISFDGTHLETYPLPFDAISTSIDIHNDVVCLGTRGKGIWCKDKSEWRNYNIGGPLCVKK